MTEPWKSLAHARWECKSYAVVVPTERGKAVDGESRASVGGLFPELARQQEGRSVAGHWLGAPVHMGRESPPTQAVASILGFLKGKRAGASARPFGRKLQNCTGAQFWARGSAGSDRGRRGGESEALTLRAQHSPNCDLGGAHEPEEKAV